MKKKKIDKQGKESQGPYRRGNFKKHAAIIA